MKRLFKSVGELGNVKFSVRIYDIDEILYDEKELTYFELGTFLLTQDFVKIEIRKGEKD